MLFDEENAIAIPNYQESFIYFLCNKNEVVYVGQTQHGIARPYSHKDKIYDTIYILNCDKNNLNILEDKYIRKYKPIYNRQNNYQVRWGLPRVRNKIREITGFEKLTIPRLRKVITLLNIKTEVDYFNGNETISFDDYTKIYDYYLKQGTEK